MNNSYKRLDTTDWVEAFRDPRERLYARLPGPQLPLPPRYLALIPWPYLCATAIAECVNRGLPHSSLYELHVNPLALWDVRYMIHEWTGKHPNPVAPLVNVIPDPKLTRFEWFIEGSGVAIGSPGC